MASVLVIVESPTEAKTIGRFLGKKDYVVTASKGHVRDLPKSRLGIDIEQSFEPKYITIRGKGKVLQELRKLAKKADNVVLATDPDREGEAISWHLAKALKLDESQPLRVVFHEITKDAILQAFENPRPIKKDLVDAQQARRILDRIVGYKLSPFLWRKVRKGLSAGRVQSVAVKLIVDREREREAFVPEEYWSIKAQLATESGDSVSAKFYGTKDKQLKLSNEAQVTEIIKAIDNAKYVVHDVKTSERKRNPSAPFTTSSMQQEAARKLGFTAKKTMVIAQQLYEGIGLGKDGTVGMITYMRTDSVEVSDQARTEARKLIVNSYGKEYYLGRKYSSKKRSQGAHEAIRPTVVNYSPEKVKKFLNSDQFKLYELIWKRFVASQMKPAIMEAVRVEIEADRYMFRATGSTIKFAGFMTLYIESEDDPTDEDEGILPRIEKGDKLAKKKIIPKQHFTEPPARFTEAMLVKVLEEKGIGRPSTYAPTIDTISRRGYVVKESRRFKPTDLAYIVTDLLEEFFGEIINVQFTARFEDDLDKIEEGGMDWVNIVDEFYQSFKKDLEVAEKEADKVEIVDEETDVICENCGRNMVIKHGRYGKFLACPGFPECRNTKPIITEIGVSCPKCDGEIVQRKSKRGRTFFGCSNYPECDFVSWNKPIDQNCPSCGNYLVEKRSKKHGVRYVCSSKECSFEKEKGDKK